MGKIQKIREQKKLEETAMQIERLQRNKKIAAAIFFGLAITGILIYGIIKFLNWKIESNDNVSKTSPTASAPATNPEAENIFPSSVPTNNSSTSNNMKKENQYVTIETAKGKIKLELYTNDAPKTVANFVSLINKGFYNGLTFHRVVPGFVVQGGDPKGDGTGGPGYTFEDEINPQSLGLDQTTIKSYEAQGYKYNYSLASHKMVVGALAMANSGPNTNGSQFFIVTDQSQPHLDGKHTVFGQVIEGLDIVKKIQQGDIMSRVSLEK